MLSVYWNLVKHDLKYRSNKNFNWKTFRFWTYVYCILFIIGVFGVFTYGSFHWKINLTTIWYFLWILPFFTFGMAIGKLKDEFKNGTYGWWLTLPYPRLTLILAKLSACAIQVVQIIIGIFVLITVLGGYISFLSPEGSMDRFVNFVKVGLTWNVIVILFVPIMLSLGLVVGVLVQSSLKPFLGFFWLLWGLFWVFFNVFGTKDNFGFFQSFFQTNPIRLETITTILTSWILSFLILILMAKVLEKYIKL
ncbi:ABC transporter permease subunit [Terrilactibacillus laevilacticus]|uniref:ABC transporter permease subunit n=1 Tax=Terrilactibacillus laevilacticus TaxID=1380157 RepID=A0ABW5PLT3_9BACI|nr:ABC transporter permease subunit [Terrilactibacillus laevilacticus]